MKRTPLRRTGRLARRAPLRAKGGSRFPKRRDPAYCAWIRTLPCVLGEVECARVVDCAHVVSRGAGGEDRGNTLPMCRTHHREQHAVGIESFQRTYCIDLTAIAARLAATHDQEDAANG